MSVTIDLIRDWSTSISYWEQAVLERLAAGVSLTERDHQSFLTLMLEESGLAPKTHTNRPTLSFPARLPSASETTTFTIERPTNLRNVNALPPTQQLTFGA